MTVLSENATKRLLIATGSKDAGNELASAINNAQTIANTQGVALVSVITGTSTSQSTDFGSLQLGDKVLFFPASAAGISFYKCQNLYAAGTVTFGTSSGAQTCTVNGTAVSYNAASDVLNAAALAAAITGNTTLAAQVTAVVDGTVAEQVNITSKLPGTAYNLTLAVTGTGATRSAATLTGGATVGELPVAGTVGAKFVILRGFLAPVSSSLTF
jgi:hypothetical protein